MLYVTFFEALDDEKQQEEKKKEEQSADQSLPTEPTESQEVQLTTFITICHIFL